MYSISRFKYFRNYQNNFYLLSKRCASFNSWRSNKNAWRQNPLMFSSLKMKECRHILMSFSHLSWGQYIYALFCLEHFISFSLNLAVETWLQFISRIKGVILITRKSERIYSLFLYTHRIWNFIYNTGEICWTRIE